MAYIITKNHTESGTNFITPNDFSQQLAYMGHKKGHKIVPHIHNPVHRDVKMTLEVLFIKKGSVKIDFYDDNRNFLQNQTLYQGDTILLASGGHGFEALEDLEMIEVKQGPYAGDADKTRFDPVTKNDIKLEKHGHDSGQ
ncbi:MAG: hypothetical protein WCT36_01510 [Candidatus Gracilibacteria bacterium]